MGDLPAAAAVKPLNGEYTPPPGEAWGGPAAAGETKGLCPALKAEEEEEGAAVEEAKALWLGVAL